MIARPMSLRASAGSTLITADNRFEPLLSAQLHNLSAITQLKWSRRDLSTSATSMVKGAWLAEFLLQAATDA
jgi:hypothetical protein